MKRDKECKDQFADWDTFMRHWTLTQDPHKALRWTRYEKWKRERELKRLRFQADMAAVKSVVRASIGLLSKNTTCSSPETGTGANPQSETNPSTLVTTDE